MDLLDERGVGVAGGEATGGAAVGVWLFTVAGDAAGEGADGGAEADASVAQDGENKGVCVEAAAVQGLEAERGGWGGGGKDVGAGFVVADGRSEAREAARGSERRDEMGVRGAGGGGGGEGEGGREDCDCGGCEDGGGKKQRGDDGERHPDSSLSISLSSFTSPGGSTPYLENKV